MIDWLVIMFVNMNLGQMEPDTEGHQQAGYSQRRRYRIVQEKHGGKCPQKWGG